MTTRTTRKTILVALLSATVSLIDSRADIVTEWNSAIRNSIRAGKTPPPTASRSLAILHVAIYDAVNSITESADSYLVPPLGHDVARATSKEAAATAAAHRVMAALYPAQAGASDGLEAAQLAAIPEGVAKANGIAWGKHVADVILAARAQDGATAVVAPPVSHGVGDWIPTPGAFAPFLLPQWGFVEPFLMQTPSQFRPAAQPALASVQYALDYNQVQELGDVTSATRTPEQTEIAKFWADGGGTETPPGHWNRIAQQVAGAKGNDLLKNARLFALLNLTLADAAIACWDAKYHYNAWRPITAIRAGDWDGNAATVGDTNWTPLIVTPPFPEHTSGHSTFSGAAATVLALFYGNDNISFSSGSDGLAGVTRHYSSFSQAANEAGMSRIYGGIHFMSANVGGLNAGESLGIYATEHYLRAKQSHGRDRDRDHDHDHDRDH